MERERRPSEDLWRRTLSGIESVFGRLEYLARIRNPHSGRYEHHGLALVYGADEAGEALAGSHRQVFAEWLGMELERQKADLELFLAEQPSGRRTTVETWRQLEPYRGLAPAGASEAEMELYLGDLKVLLEAIRNEWVDGGRGRDDWRRR